ncbi:MAG: UDP-3-O-acyl-N-acetylglucosamine deacetylase [Nitrospinota bacterium]|nr:UDP-3-O-acyl-N-acetylglucosamine deacetylase [Nitrospinota bacterium]
MPKERVLIVDDEINIVTSLQEILNDEGYEIVTAADGLDALEIVQSEPPDLVLLDIWIPGMDGIEVLQAIKTYHPEIEVLVMSGHGTIDTAVKATKLGAYDFIEKPFSLNQLVGSVERALKQKKGRMNGKGDNTSIRHELPHCFEMMVEVKKAVTEASKTNAPILIQGEVGTGKEFIAQAIQNKSKKSNVPLLKINCALRSAPKIQIELFAPQDEKGQRKKSTRGGAGKKTVYLKNIESMPLELQEQLASALESAAARKPNTLIPERIFASTTKDLKILTDNNQFHPGLHNILKENVVNAPPLRDNRALIPTLTEEYFADLEARGKVVCKNFTEETMRALCEYDWPENFKELRAILDHIARTLHPEKEITLDDISAFIHKAPLKTQDKRSFTKDPSDNRPLQRTLKRSVVLCGRGLHSGIKTGLIMQPLPPGSGIIFGDISSGNTIPAKVENVQSTEYATSLRKGYASVSTIEHIMATLHMYRVHNLLIKIGDEAPVMDGSAKDFCQLIEDGDFEEQNSPYEELVIEKTYTFGSKEDGGAFISIEPYDGFKVSYHMEYPAPIGVMDHTFEFDGADSFKKEIAPARTFGFVKDVAMLNKMGFGVGGKLDNFILLGDQKVLNTELRYENEFARHKILDILGDFYLLGKPIRGYIKAHKSGHTQNIGLLKTIKEDLAQSVPVHS